MLRLSPARFRKGFTLTEVLMAMFVMAIGMISLLALFPAAFQQAKWALDNEQVARAAGNAQSMTEMPHMPVVQIAGSLPIVGTTTQSVRDDDRYRPELSNTNLLWSTCNQAKIIAALGRPYLVDLNTPGAPTWTFAVNKSLAPPGTQVKFPPVFVDPAMADSFIDTPAFNGTLLPFQVGSSNLPTVPFSTVAEPNLGNDPAVSRPKLSLGLPRGSMSQYTMDTGAVLLRKQTEISMGDEINFDTNGQPLLAAGQFARQRRFTWGYMCNWPDYANPAICEVTAVVFNTRPDNGGLSTMPPGEVTYGGNGAAAFTAGTDTTPQMLGRVFVKGLTQATIFIGATPQPLNLKVGDWILDSTLILPEYNFNFPAEKAPFLDTIDTTPGMTNPAFIYGFPTAAPVRFLRPGLVGGQFYKVMDISEPRAAGASGFFQTVTLDRPAKSDGFSVTIISGIADVITKSVGRMPQR